MLIIFALTHIDAMIFSIVAMTIVFIVLILLTLIIAQLKRLNRSGECSENSQLRSQVSEMVNGNDQNRMVAILLASCIAKEKYSGDIRIVSCRKID